MFAYRQSFLSANGTSKVQRTGMCCTIESVPFGPRAGGGVLPHEETFSGPKEDRMALMNATRTQLSPIFGLHADERGQATAVLSSISSSRPPDFTATTQDRTLHEVWIVRDEAAIRSYQQALSGEDVFIADGHHRYTTGLNYLKALDASSVVPSDHPARRCMIVLVGMRDPGLVIWPTHRVLGGMKHYSLDAFLKAAEGVIRSERFVGHLAALDTALATRPPGTFGLWDFASKQGFLATPAQPDALAPRFPEKPRAWRDLTVAFVQYALVEQICQAKLNDAQPVKWAFPHTVTEVEEIGSGTETGAGGGKGFAQLGVIVKPTPLDAVRDVSRANQLMPQKSTFFYPKLATGLFIHPLDHPRE